MMMHLACLSPEEMQLSARIGYFAAALGVAAALLGVAVSVRRRDFVWLPFYAVLLALHPAWTISIMRGDCGDARRFLSGVVSLVFVALLSVQILRPQLSRLRFLFVLCVLAWALYLPLFLSFVFHTPFLLNDGFIGHVIEAYTLSSRDIAHIAFVLSVACAGFWFGSRLYERRATV